MSLFGIEAPKMIVNIETTKDEVLLDYVNVLKDEPEQKTYDVKSVRTGKTVFTNAGKHWIFQIKLHLWKYGVDAETKYLELKSYEGTKVILYRHRDGAPMLDPNDNDMPFILLTVNEHLLERDQFRDYVILTFVSTGFVGSPKVKNEYCADFTDNLFNTDLFELIDLPAVPNQFSVVDEKIEGKIGYNSGFNDVQNLNFELYQFRPKTISSITSDFEVTGELWKPTIGVCNRSIMLGLWNSKEYFAGICVDSAYDNNKVLIMIYDNAGKGYWEVLFDTGLDKETPTFYKVKYLRATNQLYFYYKSGLTWIELGNSPYVITDFDTRKYYPGIFCGIFNANAQEPCYGDNLCVRFTPDSV